MVSPLLRGRGPASRAGHRVRTGNVCPQFRGRLPHRFGSPVPVRTWSRRT